MSRWTFIAQRATTGLFLDWDVPLALTGLEWQLSGPGSLKASVSPDVGGLRTDDGSLLLEEWGTLLYAESGGEIRWGGIVVSSSFNGESWDLEAAGFTTYPHSRIYRGEYNRVQVDPADVIKHIWEHIQSFPDADLGVSVIGDSTPARLGEMAYASDATGVRLDYAIPHKQWSDLFAKGWIGGPVDKIDVDDTLWNWLIDHGFNRAPDNARGPVIVPPSSWTEEFPWWESEILNLGWVGGPVRRADVRPEIWDYLSQHGWQRRSWDPVEEVYPPTMAADEADYPDEVWPALYSLQWAGGAVHRADVPDWVWNRLLALGWTGDASTINRPAQYDANVTGYPSWEMDLLALDWGGGPVRHADVSDSLWNTLLQGHWWALPAIAEDGSLILDPATYYTASEIYPPVYVAPALSADDTVTEAAPYTLSWWESPNCGDEIDTLTKSTPLDYAERHRWSADGASIIHEVEIGYPRLGRRRDDLLFEEGVNVIDIVTVESNGDEFANTVIGLGAGEGRSVLRREVATRDGRLARDYLYADKAVTDEGSMDARIAEELAARKAAIRITSITATDHPNAPLGSWQLGDDVLVRARLPWLGEIEMWVRITGWSLTGETTASLTVSRSDLFRYGG